MSQKILDIYQSILAFSGRYVSEDGTIYGQLTSSLDKTKTNIDGEPLVFPIRKQFDDTNQAKFYFHPLSESFVRGESEVIKKLREDISLRLNYVTVSVAQQLLKLLGSPALHKKLNEQQSELLKYIGDADEKACLNWSSLMRRVIENSPDSGYIKIYLRKAGILKGESYARLGVVTFPFYKDLIEDKYESNIRVKDKIVFKKLLEFIFPGLDQPETYNYGTRTQIAPYLDALMMTSAKLASQLNDIIDIYKEYIDDADNLQFDMNWYSYLQNIDALRADIKSMPELRGNAGATTVNERVHPYQQIESKALSEAPQLAAISPVPVTTVQTTMAPQQQQVVHPIAQQPLVPVVRQNEHGAINFTDILKANPVMAMAQNPLAQNPMQLLPPNVQAYYNQTGMLPPGFVMPQQMMPQSRPPPSWAAPQVHGMYPNAGQYPAGYPNGPQQQVFSQQMLPQPPPGYQYVLNPATNQYVLVPLQQQPMQQQGPPFGTPLAPTGWSWK